MKITIKNLFITAVINNKGAELISLKDKNNREYIWQGNPEFWGKHSPVLFPIVGTLKNNSFSYNAKKYNLLRHGFARDQNFELIEQTESQAIFSFIANDETKKMYPFDFELQLCYTLEKTKLILTYKIINKDKVTIPFSIGGHPAFALSENFENYSLRFEKKETLSSYQLENDLISTTVVPIAMKNNILELTYSLFEKDALIFKKLNSKEITIMENNNALLNVHFKDFPNLGIWTKNNASFICIEPWLGYSDKIDSSGNILEKEAIQLVGANKTFNCSFSVEIFDK
mgnify:CR=1 FL=1